MSDQDFSEDVAVVGSGEFGTSNDEKAKISASPAAPTPLGGVEVLERLESFKVIDENANNDDEKTHDIPKGTDDNAAEDRKLFVGGLSWETKEPQLKEYFEKFGEVESVNLKINALTGKSRCFAFVVFKNAEDLSKVFESGDHAINSKKVDVKKAKAKPGKIFIGGLKPDLTDEEIRSYFDQFGNIIEFEMPFDKIKNQRRTFGFITFEREETMKELIKKSKVQIGSHEIDLRKATPKNNDFGFRNGSAAQGDYFGGFGYGYGAEYYGGYYGSWTTAYSAMGGAGVPNANPSLGGGKIRTRITNGSEAKQHPGAPY